MRRSPTACRRGMRGSPRRTQPERRPCTPRGRRPPARSRPTPGRRGRRRVSRPPGPARGGRVELPGSARDGSDNSTPGEPPTPRTTTTTRTRSTTKPRERTPREAHGPGIRVKTSSSRGTRIVSVRFEGWDATRGTAAFTRKTPSARRRARAARSAAGAVGTACFKARRTHRSVGKKVWFLVLAETQHNAPPKHYRSTTAHAFFLAYTTYIGSVLPGLGDMSCAAGGSKPPAK